MKPPRGHTREEQMDVWAALIPPLECPFYEQPHGRAYRDGYDQIQWRKPKAKCPACGGSGRIHFPPTYPPRPTEFTYGKCQDCKGTGRA